MHIAHELVKFSKLCLGKCIPVNPGFIYKSIAFLARLPVIHHDVPLKEKEFPQVTGQAVH